MKLQRLVPHICFILAGMFVVFCVIDYFNSAMEFINNDISKYLLFALSIFSIITSVLLMYRQHKSEP